MNLSIYDDSYHLFCNGITTDFPAILDIGCGPANIAKYISGQIPNADISGIDYSEKMIELAKKNVPDGKFEVMDCRDINKIKKRFDAVICGFCLPYLNEKERDSFFSDVHNLLKNNGIAYFSFVEGNPEHSGYQTSGNGHRLFFNFHLLKEVKQNLKKYGFKNIQILKINYERSENETEIHTIIITKNK